MTEDPGSAGHFKYRGWTSPYWNDELAEHQSELLFASDALLLGRRTWEEFVATWPLRSGDPFTEKMDSMAKFVASTTLEEPLEWNSTLLTGDITTEVQRLKQQPGQDLLTYGSAELVNTPMTHNLIDVYRLMLYPLALASRKRFFKEAEDKTTLTLTDARTTSTGVVVLTYHPAGSHADESGPNIGE